MPLKFSFEFLTKAAIYGAVLSVSGSAVLYYLIQRNIAHSQYYTQAVQALRQDQRACRFLGEPIRFQFLKLGDKQNRVTETHAQVLIPVSGSRTAGYLRSNATHHQGKWKLEFVQLEFRGRPEVVVIVDQHQEEGDFEQHTS